MLSFNTRTGAVTLDSAPTSRAAGGALLSSPTFSGVPKAPTPVATDSSTTLATTAFVQAAIAAGGGVSSFNGRAGVVTFTAADLLSVSGAFYHQSDTPPAGAQQTFWFDSLNGQLYVQYVDPSTSAKSWVATNTPPPGSTPHGVIGIQTFTASGTYTPTAGMTSCVVECGGGGAAGFGAPTSTASQSIVGGGGGGGATARKFLTAAAIGASQIVTVGAGGTPGAVGSNPGGAGGDSSFGTLCIAKGAPASTNGGGPGGPMAGCVGDVIIAGGCGLGQFNQNSVNMALSVGGAGGTSFFGGGAPGNSGTSNLSGIAAPGFCGGGQGACSYNGGGNRQGGPGGGGLVVVTEYA